MESLYLLIPIALVIIVLAVKLLFWAINNGQYDDLNTEGHRILFYEPTEKKQVSSVDAGNTSPEKLPSSPESIPSKSIVPPTQDKS